MVASVETEGAPDVYGWLTDNREIAAVYGFPQVATETISLKPHEIYQTPTSQSVNGTNMSDREYDVSSLTLKIDTELGTLTSITARQEFYDQFNLDRDGTAGVYLDTLIYQRRKHLLKN